MEIRKTSSKDKCNSKSFCYDNNWSAVLYENHWIKKKNLKMAGVDLLHSGFVCCKTTSVQRPS